MKIVKIMLLLALGLCIFGCESVDELYDPMVQNNVEISQIIV